MNEQPRTPAPADDPETRMARAKEVWKDVLESDLEPSMSIGRDPDHGAPSDWSRELPQSTFQGADEDDDRQYIQRDRKTEVFLEVLAEDELDAVHREIENVTNATNRCIEHDAALRHIQHEGGDGRLQKQRRPYRSPVDAAARR